MEQQEDSGVTAVWRSPPRGMFAQSVPSPQEQRLLEAKDVFLLLASAVSVLGIAANTINVAVFTKQGFKESINVSLMALAISDMCILVTLFPFTIMSWFEFSGETILPMGTSTFCRYVWYTFSFNSSWIAVFISVERCLCVTIPMKVKDIMTPRVAKVAMVILYAIALASIIPAFFALEMTTMRNPMNNSSRLMIVQPESKRTLHEASFYMLTFLQNGSFICLLCSTLIMALTLKKQSDWRSKTMSNKSDAVSVAMKRDNQVIKMVTLVCVITLVCFLPGEGLALATLALADLTQGAFRYWFRLLWTIGIAQYAINASINIFVYYYMSSKYRNTFLSIFRKEEKGEIKEKNKETS